MAVLANEKILTLDYWKTASQLEVGDYIFNKNGKLVRIKALHKYVPEKCYEVTLSDHLTFCGDEHACALVEDQRYRLRAYLYKGVQNFRRPLKALRLGDLIDMPLIKQRPSGIRESLYSIPTCKPLNLPHQDLPVPPFVFGFWFRADGKRGRHTTRTNLFSYIKEKFKEVGFNAIRPTEEIPGRIRFYMTPKVKFVFPPNIPAQIPNNYLLASIEQRIELLSGIVCAKYTQYEEKRNLFKITSASWQTIHRIQGLVESLGCKTSTIQDRFTGYYELIFKTWHKIHPDQKPITAKVNQDRRYIKKIKEIPAQMCVHIQTEEENGSFLVGEGFIICR